MISAACASKPLKISSFTWTSFSETVLVTSKVIGKSYVLNLIIFCNSRFSVASRFRIRIAYFVFWGSHQIFAQVFLILLAATVTNYSHGLDAEVRGDVRFSLIFHERDTLRVDEFLH